MTTTELERLAGACKRQAVDRPPMICPGGMMNAVTDEMARIAEIPFPEVHHDGHLMAQMAKECHDLSGFENYGVPFCMTVEAEAMGATVDFGDSLCEPHVVNGSIKSVKELRELSPIDLNAGRPKAVLDAIRELKALGTCVPVIGDLTGPFSVAGTVLDCEILLRELRKYHDESIEYMKFIAGEVAKFGRAMVEAGADCVCIAEPTGTGEILGPKFFEEFSVQFLNVVLDHMQAPTSIVHICGDMTPVLKYIGEIHCDAFSFDAMTPVGKVHEAAPGKALMGNVSTFALGREDMSHRIAPITKAALKNGVNILAPACGIATVTPLDNLHIMKSVVLEPVAVAEYMAQMAAPEKVEIENKSQDEHNN